MKLDLSFSHVSDALRHMVLPQVDLVVGIARGGLVPASLLAHQLGCDMVPISINYRDDANHPRYGVPRLLQSNPLPAGVRRILLVDDVSVSGATLASACEALPDVEVTTLVLKGRADLVVFPDITTCVNWPWNVPQHQPMEVS